MFCTGYIMLGQSPSAFFAAAAPAIRAADRVDSTIKVLHVFLEDPIGIEPTRCVMVFYWGAPMYALREFIKNYNVVQLAPNGQEVLSVLGATPLGRAIDSAQAERAKFFSLDFLRTRFRPLLDQQISDPAARTLFRQMEVSH